MANWNERDQDWRGPRGGQRYEGRQDAGYSRAQNDRQGDYGGEDRSWNAGSQYDQGRRDYGGDQRRYGQGGGDQERGRYGGERYGNQGYSGQSYGGRASGDQGYGVEWSDRDSYDSRRHDSDYASDYRSDYRSAGYDYGDRRYGRESYRADHRQGGREAGFGDPNPYVQAATDGESQGAHRGRGPKDYKRSDDRIREDVNDRLTDDAHIDASGIQVAVKDGEVTLTGTVENRFAKRHAEDLVERISGARHVQNNLRVQDGRWDQADTGSTSTATSRGSSTLS